MKNILDSIEISSEYIGNGKWGADKWRSDKWEVCLYRGAYKITVEFFLGEGNNGRAPELKEVVFALLNDAQAGELSFEDFCSDFGYDTDSRRAYATWEACKENREKLLAIFSPDEIAELEVDFENY